jgi:pyridoxal phosphate enzyme (YggS family)
VPADRSVGGHPLDAEAVGRRVEAVRLRVAAACAAAGRPVNQVRLLAAAKTQSAESVAAVIAAGVELIGENRVQELVAKGPALSAWPHQSHLIGPLQSNKVNAALRWADCVETVDSLRLAERLSSRALARGGPLDVMVQVNVSGEATKAGVPVAEATALAEAVAMLEGLRLTGFMTVGPNVGDPVQIRRAYASLRRIRDQVATSGAPGTADAVELSMGMSGDIEEAVAEGATIVRVGAAIFGPRR